MQDLKRQTAYRLAQEGGQSEQGENPTNDESSEVGAAAAAVSSSDQSTTTMHYQQYPQGHQHPREPAGYGGGGSPYVVQHGGQAYGPQQPARGAHLRGDDHLRGPT